MCGGITFCSRIHMKMVNLLEVHRGRMEGVAPLSMNISIGVSFIDLAVNMLLSLYCYHNWERLKCNDVLIISKA